MNEQGKYVSPSGTKDIRWFEADYVKDHNLQDKIDYEVGVFLNKQIGDTVNVGDTLCTLYYNKMSESYNIADAFTIVDEQ